MRTGIIITLSLVCSVAAAAETPAKAPCTAPEYRQFDFWIGEWRVTAGGKLVGHNSITPIHGGCALREEWRGAGGGAGTSLNAYDQNSRRWYQTWVDKHGLVLRLEGTLVSSGGMVMEAERRSDGKIVRDRITWSPVDADTVRQLWETKSDGQWETVFDGTYARVNNK